MLEQQITDKEEGYNKPYGVKLESRYQNKLVILIYIKKNWDRNKYRSVCVPVCVGIYTYIFQLNLLWGSRSKDIPVAMSTHSTYTLVSKHHFPIKGIRAPRSRTWFKAGARKTRWTGNTQSWGGRKCSKMDRSMLKGQRNQLEWNPNGQS